MMGDASADDVDVHAGIPLIGPEQGQPGTAAPALKPRQIVAVRNAEIAPASYDRLQNRGIVEQGRRCKVLHRCTVERASAMIGDGNSRYAQTFQRNSRSADAREFGTNRQLSWRL